VEFVGLEKMTPLVGEPLAGKARMLVQSGRDHPVMATEFSFAACAGSISETRQASWARFHPPRAFDGDRQTARALPANVTAVFTLVDSIGLENAASTSTIHRQIKLDVYRAANNHLLVGIAIADLADQAPDKTDLEEHKSEKKAKPPAGPPGKTG